MNTHRERERKRTRSTRRRSAPAAVFALALALELEIAVTIAKLAPSPQLKFNTDIYCLQLIVVNYLSVQIVKYGRT